MVDVALKPVQDILGGVAPAPAYATATVYNGFKPAIRTAGSTVTFPTPVTVNFTYGDAGILQLQQLPAGDYYQIVVAPIRTADSSLTLRVNAVLPVGAGPFLFSDLVVVDPKTALPDAGTSIAAAYASQLQTIATQATTAANAAAASAAAAAAVPLSNDGIVTGLIGGPSTTKTALDATYGAPAIVDGTTAVGSALRALFAPRLTPMQAFVQKARTGLDNLVIAIAGDSTGDETPEWFCRTMDDFCSIRPWLTNSYKIWDDTSQTYTTSTRQTGADQTVKVRTAADKFDRTAAELVGSTADHAYGVWAGSTGAFSIDGAAAAWVASTGYVTLPGALSAGVKTVSGSLTIDTTAGASTKQVSIGMHAPGPNRLTIFVKISTAGAITWGIEGQFTAFATIATGGGTPLAASSVQTVPYSVTVNGTAVSTTLNGVTVTGTLTTAQATSAASMLNGYILPSGPLTGMKVNDIALETVVTDRTATALTVYNGSRSGSTLDYQIARLAALYPVAPDLLFISSSHNYNAGTVADYFTALDTFIAAFQALYPATAIAVVSQNPEIPPVSDANRLAHRRRCLALRQYARLRGYEYVPGIEAFDGRADLGQVLIRPDGKHPTAAGSFDDLTDPNNGDYVWKEAARKWLEGYFPQPV